MNLFLGLLCLFGMCGGIVLLGYLAVFHSGPK